MVRKIGLVWIIPVLLLTSCNESQPDYTPFGDGMKAIAICLVVAAVVRALAELAVSDKVRKDHEAKRKRPRRDQSKGGEQ